MHASHRYATTLGRTMNLPAVPVLIAGGPDEAQVAVALLASSAPASAPGAQLPRDDAFLVCLQLADRRHLYSDDDGAAPACDLKAGDSVLWDLRRGPRVQVDGAFRALHVRIPHAAFDALTDDLGTPRIGELRGAPAVGVADGKIFNLGLSLLPEFERSDADRCNRADRWFVDHVVLALVGHVACSYGVAAAAPARGGLAAWQERRAKEILDAHLGGSISVTQIAAQCGLSASHFSRSFRRSTGMAPYTWLMQRRVDAAKMLLRNRRMALAEVAAACGFADQSHFTRTFTRAIGTSPGSWRRDVAG